MRKWKAALLALMMLLSLCFSAAADDSIRHEVTGDISEIVVGDEIDTAHEEHASEAQVGTDVYLFVDPDSASYITFLVVDEFGDPIRNAEIYFSYNGHEEFYGLTDEFGQFSTYLFRGVEYGYRVEKTNYKTERGLFTAPEETKLVRVVLQQYHTLDIIVLHNGKPVEGVKIQIGNTVGYTDATGGLRVWRVNGLYPAQIYLPNGVIKTVYIRVDGSTLYFVDIGVEAMPEELMDVLEAEGGDSDLFIVFNKIYAPEDYDLTMQIYTDEEALAQLDTQTLSEDEVQAALDQWHALNPDYLHIVAEADKRQGMPDQIVTKYGQPRFSQRSLILGGRQLLQIENAGMESILFENEDLALWFDIADLYSNDVAKLFHLIDAKHQSRRAYTSISIQNIDVSTLKLSAVEDVWRWKDDPAQKPSFETMPQLPVLPILEEKLFADSCLEVRITPLLAEEVLRAVDGEERYGRVKREDMEEVVLISSSLQAKWLRDYLARGNLTETEYREFKALVVDSTAYRVQVFLRIDGVEVNVTDLLPSLEVRMDVNTRLQKEAEAYAEAQAVRPGESRSVQELAEVFRTTVYAEEHVMQLVRNLGIQADTWRYKSGDAVQQRTAQPVSGLMDENHALYEPFMAALQARTVDVYDVDVRHETYKYQEVADTRYYAWVTPSYGVQDPPQEDWTVCWPEAQSGTYFIRER